MAKFKVGDRVIANEKVSMNYGCIEVGDMGIVININDLDFDFLSDDGGQFIGLDYDYFDLISFTKNDLQDGDIVTLRNGDRLIYGDENFFDLNTSCHNGIYMSCHINTDLTRNREHHTDEDIVKVERPTEYKTVFVRKEKEVKKMTVSQICEELGYDVEIIKEDE